MSSLLSAAQKRADVVARLTLIEELTEHLNAGDHRLRRRPQANDLDLLADLEAPRSTLPVATVPRPEIENTSSTGIRNGLIDRALGLRNIGIHRIHQLQTDFVVQSGLRPRAPQRRALNDRNIVARENRIRQQLANLHLDELQKSASSTMSTLFMKTTIAGTPTWRASRICSRVCGIGPSAARPPKSRHPSAPRR